MGAADTLSVIVPARNEQSTLAAVVRNVSATAGEMFADHEIVIVDDGSTDGTGAQADRLAVENGRIRVIHHVKSRNLGGAVRSGLGLAGMDYVCVVHGNGGTTREALQRIWARRGQGDLVIPYMSNARERPFPERMASRTFTALLNMLFGLRIRYYLHHVLYPRTLLASVDIRTNSYAFQPEAIVKLVKRGCTYVEVGVEDTFDKHGPTRSYAPRNLAGVAVFLVRCWRDLHRRPVATGTPR